MWLLDKSPFEATSERVGAARQALDAARGRGLTLVVGNGLSQSAVYEAQTCARDERTAPLGWNAIVARVYEDAFKQAPPRDANSLIVAERVARHLGKRPFLEALHEGLDRLGPCHLHRMLLRLGADAIVTTNYDLVMDRALAERGSDWMCFVRDAWRNEASASRSLKLFKMHGTLAPMLKGSDHRYRLPGQTLQNLEATPQSDVETENSVVITESDYDTCNEELAELGRLTEGAFWSALDNTLLIVGKGISWEDLSFMYALRHRRRRCEPTCARAFWIVSSLSGNAALALDNYGIEPLVLNMPRQRADNGIHYFSLVEALRQLFPDVIIDEMDPRLMVERKRLVKPPAFVAIGLSAHNTVGRVKFSEAEYSLPAQGRRNHEFADAEEYAGGSALTALGTFAALSRGTGGTEHERGRCALISVVGDDVFAATVRKFCQRWGVDDDAVVSIPGRPTWRSTVLVHDVRGDDTEVFAGQRVFLDRPFDEAQLDEDARDQFRAMLSTDRNPELRVVYLDKWLAYGPQSSGQDTRHPHGFLGDENNLSHLRGVADKTHVDILYETGGTGSNDGAVERRLAPCINILAASFPFFARQIVGATHNERGSLEAFIKSSDHRRLTFLDERRAIIDLLDLYVKGRDTTAWHPVPSEWSVSAREFLARPHRRRWVVVTLHDLGALAINLSAEQPGMRYVRSPIGDDQSTIQNTTGAGDVFRGAFCYGLTRFLPPDVPVRSQLARCTAFAVRCASARCEVFGMAEAHARFASEEKAWEREILDTVR